MNISKEKIDVAFSNIKNTTGNCIICETFRIKNAKFYSGNYIRSF